jgi:hypothetical protein
MFNSKFSILIRKEKRPHVCEPSLLRCDLVLHRWNIWQPDIHFG